MAAPPNRTELVDDYPNPSTGVFKAGLGKFYDYVKGLLGATGDAAEARTALGLIAGLSSSIANPGYFKFPSYLGGLVIQWGNTAVSTDTGGNAAITFPMTFPGGAPKTVLAWRGPNGGAAASIVVPYGTGYPTASVHAITLRNSSTGAVITSTSVEVAWIAIGN